MLLSKLIEGLELEPAGGADVEIGAVTDDSRRVQRGGLFVARSGSKTDGRRFVADALAHGAAAVVCDQKPEAPGAAVWVTGRRIDNALVGTLAERLYGCPSRKLKLVGITGTKGKTTIAFLIQHLLRRAGWPCGMIGTVYIDDGKARQPAELTTPGAADFSRYLAAMVGHGCRAAAAEVSSQALDQGRVAALEFQVAVFTNLTGDHLDYHLTMDRYAEAKAMLFRGLAPSAVAVVNDHDPYTPRMLAGCRAQVLRCGLAEAGAEGADATRCTATVLEMRATHTRARFHGPWGELELEYPLVGRHNAMNLLQALAGAYALCGKVEGFAVAAGDFPGVPGRLERVTLPGSAGGEAGPSVLVDYAHTHDALEKVLEALRPLVVAPGKLVVVFGCGGDRDRTKRPKMGAVACRLADRVVITSDNPRTEDPQAIIREVLAGLPPDLRVGGGDGSRVLVEPDRASAIMHAVTSAGAHDVVLLAGKGHEDYQIIGASKRHFDDREHAAAALRQRGAATPSGAAALGP
jgi:UDP-N-acetylmuramoyl-L-alanyl-D-glutamate--2,6-diaminopimelate ligase